MSQLKFSSNVIEKCLESKLCDSKVDMLISGVFENDDATLLLELSPADRKNKQARVSIIVDRLIFHQFGNYGKPYSLLNLSIVLQKLIQVVESQHLRVLVLQRVAQLSGELQKSKHGLKVLQKLQKSYPAVMGSTQQSPYQQQPLPYKPQRKYTGGKPYVKY